MAAKKENDQKHVSQKETMINEAALKISTALESLKKELGTKKFDKRVRKAAKLLVDGLKLDTVKKTEIRKSPIVKKSQKETKAAPVKKIASVKKKS